MVAPLAIAAPTPHRRPTPYGRSDAVDRILGVGMTVEIGTGQTIVFEGDPLRHCFRILDGAVRLYTAIADGRRQVIDFLWTGDCFGVLGHARFSYTAEAMVPTTLARHPRDLVNEAVAKGTPPVGQLFEMACCELERTQGLMLLLGRKNADEKIATFILSMADRGGGPADDGTRLRLPMSRQDLADYLGLTIETVSRTFSRLKRQGLIALPTPQEVVVRRSQALRVLADGLG